MSTSSRDGYRIRAMRKRLGLSLFAASERLGISVSYLSQIENGDRALTGAVIVALARAFPLDWAEIAPDHHDGVLVRAVAAATDPTVADALMAEDALRRAARLQPQLAERLIALHSAYRRSQDQLAALDDRLPEDPGDSRRLPWEDVREWFHEAGNYIDPIDRAAEALHADLAGSHLTATLIEQRLRREHGITVAPAESTTAVPALRAFDVERRCLRLDPFLAPESRLFALAYQLASAEIAPEIARVAGQAALRSPEAGRLLSIGLANYAAGALLMPYGAFREEARRLRHDIDQLRQRFGTSFEQTCHRLSTLQRPGASGVPFFFCRVDMAGNITKRHSATRLQFARFGGACPLWIVHEAVAIPDRIQVQLAEMPDGARYVSMAKGLVKPTGSYRRSPRRYAVALGCEIDHAGSFIYADQLALTGSGSAVPIGSSCRVCPRSDCDQRAFPAAGRTIKVDPNSRHAVPYTFD